MSENPQDPTPLDSTQLHIPALQSSQLLSGRYLLREIIGRGGMGVVWLAFDQKLDRDVALKLLPEAIAHDPGSISRLKEETRRSLELTHPNIVRIHDLVEDGTVAAISMEHVRGRNLSILRDQRTPPIFDPEALIGWIIQLASALDYAHLNRKIAHRDIKPSNVIIASQGDLKLADFGIARNISESMSRMTGSVSISGTLAYMSPQQLDGAPPRISDDIYSFGATIYDLLAGSPPFHIGDIPYQIRNSTPAPIETRRAELQLTGGPIPPAWQKVIGSCLEKNPEKRPQTAGEVASRLKAALVAPTPGPNNPTIPAVTDQMPEPGKSGTTKLAWGIASTLLLCGIAASIVQLFKSNPRSNNPDPNPAARPAARESSPRRWTNSLGQIFVPVPDTKVLFSIWETRARDFETFVLATGYDAKQLVGSMRTNGWKYAGDSWKSLAPTPDHPATGLSWDDATEFCRWLTLKERASGVIQPEDLYRLPTDAEWSMAVGPAVYPWGNAWPPPGNVANLCGDEPKDDKWLIGYKTISGFSDGFARTSPVGTYPTNKFGLYDMAGNVYEYCDGFYQADLVPKSLLEKVPQLKDDGGGKKHRIMRGGSWADNHPISLMSEYRERTPANLRFDNRGFRCVLARQDNTPPPTIQ